MMIASTTSCLPYLSGDIKICLLHCFLECIVFSLLTFPIFITSFSIQITLIIFLELAQFNTMNAGMLEWPISFMSTFTCRGKLRVYENKMAKDQ